MFDMTLFRVYLRHLFAIIARCRIKRSSCCKREVKGEGGEERGKEYKTVSGNNVCRLLFESRWNYILAQTMAQNTEIMD